MWDWQAHGHLYSTLREALKYVLKVGGRRCGEVTDLCVSESSQIRQTSSSSEAAKKLENIYLLGLGLY